MFLVDNNVLKLVRCLLKSDGHSICDQLSSYRKNTGKTVQLLAWLTYTLAQYRGGHHEPSRDNVPRNTQKSGAIRMNIARAKETCNPF